MSQNLKTLVSKLNDSTRRAAERAANLCMARGHYEVDLEHLFLALLEAPKGGLRARARASIDGPHVVALLTQRRLCPAHFAR